ncbi:hypothetical protein MACJ_000444 [Theileria orientalis]|uniref:Uncharacterized protein n=1 Tax=Theileria orientalis TaxID=68886 RepID=A0A976QPT0_THEOR|nr:hypothetical protein MACJ_000444 [Theileria orientalis]
MKLSYVQFGVLTALLAILINMVGADRTDHSKIKADMELKSSKSLEGQRTVLAKINKVSDVLTTEGERALGDFKSYVGRLIPHISQPTSEPFMDNIQEYINSKTGDRQQISKSISDIKMYRKKAEKEIANSEKRYNKLLDHLSKSSENDKAISHARSHHKALVLAKDRMLEINQRIVELGPALMEKVELINLANKKLDLYKLLLEMVKRARGIVAESRKAYIGSFSTKDKILDAYNRMDSLVKRAKLVKGDTKNKTLYKAETEKLNSLWDELNKLKNNISTNSKKASKTLEHIHSTVDKGERYEKSIIEEGSSGTKISSDSANSAGKGVDSLSKAFLRGKEIYNKLTKLQKITAEDVATMDKYNKETTELLKKGNDLVGEMEGINKKRSSIAKKTLNLSTPQDLGELVGMDDVASDDSGSSSESESEESTNDVKESTNDAKEAKATDKSKTKSYDTSDVKVGLSKRAKKRKTRKELDEIKNKAIGSYLNDMELSDESSKSGNSEVSDNDTSHDSDTSTETSPTGNITKSKKDAKRSKPAKNSRGASSSKSTGNSESSSSVNDRKDEGLIQRGFNFLKKLATAPESLFQSADSSLGGYSSDYQYYDAHKRLQDREEYSDSGVEVDARPQEHKPVPISNNQKTIKEASQNQIDEPLPPSHTRIASVEPQGIRYNPGDAPIDLKPEEEEEYRRAVRESVIMDLQRKAREDLESSEGFKLADAASKAQHDLFKLVRLSYELKEQFELVKQEFRSSFQFNAGEILKNILRDLLHQYLSSVCSVALEMTKPRYFQMFNSSPNGLFGIGGPKLHSSTNPNRANPTRNAQTGNRRVAIRASGMQGNAVISGRVAPKRSYKQISESESHSDYGNSTAGSAKVPRVAVATAHPGTIRVGPYVSQQVQAASRPVPAQRQQIQAPTQQQVQQPQPQPQLQQVQPVPYPRTQVWQASAQAPVNLQ